MNIRWEKDIWDTIMKRQWHEEREGLKAPTRAFTFAVLFSLLVSVSCGQGIRTSETALTALEEANLRINSLGVGCAAPGTAGGVCYEGCLKRGGVVGYALTLNGDPDSGLYDGGGGILEWRILGTNILKGTTAGFRSYKRLLLGYGTDGSEGKIHFSGEAGNVSLELRSGVDDSSRYCELHTYFAANPGDGSLSVAGVKITSAGLMPGANDSRNLGKTSHIWSALYSRNTKTQILYDLSENIVASFTSGYARFKKQIFGHRIELDETDSANGCQINVGNAASSTSANVAIYGGGADNKPGMLLLEDDTGGWGVLWMDTAGNLRGSNAIPTDDDTDGVIIKDLSP